jgi:hypothetical protein
MDAQTELRESPFLKEKRSGLFEKTNYLPIKKALTSFTL